MAASRCARVSCVRTSRARRRRLRDHERRCRYYRERGRHLVADHFRGLLVRVGLSSGRPIWMHDHALRWRVRALDVRASPPSGEGRTPSRGDWSQSMASGRRHRPGPATTRSHPGRDEHAPAAPAHGICLPSRSFRGRVGFPPSVAAQRSNRATLTRFRSFTGVMRRSLPLRVHSAAVRRALLAVAAPDPVAVQDVGTSSLFSLLHRSPAHSSHSGQKHVATTRVVVAGLLHKRRRRPIPRVIGTSPIGATRRAAPRLLVSVHGSSITPADRPRRAVSARREDASPWAACAAPGCGSP